MIQSDKIAQFPAWIVARLTPYSFEELRIARELGLKILESSKEAQVVYDNDTALLVYGVIQPTLLGPAHFWFLLCRDFSPRYARAVARRFPEIFQRFPVIQTNIEKTFRSGCRFAEFFGFRPTGREVSALGRHYETYEARR